jgi:hypothetical protein
MEQGPIDAYFSRGASTSPCIVNLVDALRPIGKVVQDRLRRSLTADRPEGIVASRHERRVKE